MSKPTKRKTIPEAPANISRQINRLAEIRAGMKSLMEKSKEASKKIIAFGSCHNTTWRAYVRLQQERFCQYRRKAGTSIVLKPMRKEKS